MGKFTKTLHKEHDGTRECNRSEIEDDQCDVCLDTTIRDWYIRKSFIKHKSTERTICIDCVKLVEDSIWD